ncbi:MAG: peptidoglycan DL-endopeptidase RipA [Mycobacterium sp.]|nr:peptidoglycan DL-endopeptidase RipA [Mycobacterium sp.]
MRTRTSNGKAIRRIALFAAVAVSAALINASNATAKPSPPPNPTDSQLARANAARTALASQLGQVSARIVMIQSQIRKLESGAQAAAQKLAVALQWQLQAEDTAAAAKATVTAARAQVEKARRDFVSYIQASYMDGHVDVIGMLLTATDPSLLLEQGTLADYETSHQLDAIGNLQQAKLRRSNAELVGRETLAKETQAAHEAQIAKQNVLAALAAATSERTALNNQLAAQQMRLNAAQIKLTRLTGQRIADDASQLGAERVPAANAANQGGEGSPAPPPPGGTWSPAKGLQAVNRAMTYLGTPYSWAAGNASGPTYGVSGPGAARNDSKILGFDCSALMLYAWAPWLSMDHNAARQYWQAGHEHPSIDNLRPGDLIFWSAKGTIGSIDHVAMDIGGGDVIQAPQSGDVIKITNIYDVESGYFGATRPLT